MALHSRAFTQQRPTQHSHSSIPAFSRTTCRNFRASLNLCRTRAAQSWVQSSSFADTSTPEGCAMQILSMWQDRNLEGLLPYMSELCVVKAVVRQHHAKLEEQKQQARLQEQQARLQEQQHPKQQAQHSSSNVSRGYSSGLATYDSTYGSSYSSYDSITPIEAEYSVQHWAQPPQVYPPRPPCPVPGVNTPDYINEYDSFNYTQRYATPRPSHGIPPPSSSGSSSTSTNNTDAQQQQQQQDSNMPQQPQQQQQRPAVRVPDFLSVLDAAQAGDTDRHLMDSYAMRHLILSRPAQLEPLSGMKLGPDCFVLRVRSTSLWGEKCVLTLTLKRRSDQEQKSTYSKQPHKEPWVLSKVVGEPLSSDPLEAISPEHPPETIVAAQVQALKECDFDVAYSLTSPVGRAVAGTRDRFRAALQGDFRYQPVLMHDTAVSVHRTHSNANTYLEVFEVTGCPGAPSSLFIWVATRQLEGLYKNCWMVEYVTPIKDPAVIKALQLGL